MRGNSTPYNAFGFSLRTGFAIGQALSSARMKIGKKRPIVEKVTTTDLRDAAANKMPVQNLLEDIHTQPLPEFHHALLTLMLR
jgi:hypothetical protein